MNLLAIETSAPVGSIAVQCAGKVSEASIATPREQTSRILPLIDELLSAAGISLQALDGIAFGRGPGSFTGIRVATAVAQGLGLAAATPLLPVSCLAATAQRAWREFAGKASLVSLDARMGEVFWCGFTMQSGLPSALGIERLSSPRAVRWEGEPGFFCVGNAFAQYSEELAEVVSRADAVEAACAPSAADLLPLAAVDLESGQGINAVEAVPVYLRGQDAWES